MLIVLKSGTEQSEIDHVIERLGELGMKAHISKGQYRTVIGAMGEENETLPDLLKTIDCVESVTPVMKPYKMASRDFHKADTIIDVAGVKVGGGNYALIAGPCAIEIEEDCHATAKAVKAAGANMLRGGAFKPRTSPYSFQGMGEAGLKILRECGDENGLPIVTEVMDPRNVELVARYADVVQIGARNMQNYVLLSEVGKIRKPVLLKRGSANTVQEWLMSAEYILSEGNHEVILCERGSTGFEPELRYNLDIGAIVAARRRTHLPIIVDPSHAAGHRDFVIDLALAGLAAGADGFIVEVHNCPERAKCDGPQALTDVMFAELMQLAKKVIAARQA